MFLRLKINRLRVVVFEVILLLMVINAAAQQDSSADVSVDQKTSLRPIEELSGPKYPPFVGRGPCVYDVNMDIALARVVEGAIFMEYVLMDSLLRCYVYSHKGTYFYTLDYNDHFKTQLQYFKKLVQIPSSDNSQQLRKEFQQEGYRLYEQLVAPVVDFIPDFKYMTVMNAQSLLSIPFEVLPVTPPKDSALDWHEMPYLLQQYPINYQFSKEQWWSTSQAVLEPNGKVLLIENGEQESGLVLKKELSKVYKEIYSSKSKNTEQLYMEIQQGDFGIIQFNIPFVEKDSSTIELQLGAEVDSMPGDIDIWLPYEFSLLNGEANLLVLSGPGPGKLALARYAESPALLLKFWDSEHPTSQLILLQYYEYLSGGMSKGEALRLAKLDYLEQNRGAAAHPALWAAYLQFGNVQPIPLAKKPPFIWYIAIGIGLLGGGRAALGLFRRRKRRA